MGFIKAETDLVLEFIKEKHKKKKILYFYFIDLYLSLSSHHDIVGVAGYKQL